MGRRPHMNASELFKAGQLQAAIDAQIQEVKKNAADPAKRIFLFELASFAGDLERAKRQIDAVNFEQIDRQMVVLDYKKLIDSETIRRTVFREGKLPHF